MIFCRAGDTGTSDWAETAVTAARPRALSEASMVKERGGKERPAG